jgi:DNA-binding LytR/AlgR family response regulator
MKKTCLIVDDEPESVYNIRRYVEQTGLVTVVAVAHTPTEAISSALLHKPDLIITDIQMPELKGTDMARIIQKNYRCMFIIISGHPDFALESYDLDTVHYLLKPVSYPNVFEALTKFIRFSGKEAEQAEGNKPGQEVIELSLWAKNEKLHLRLSDVSYFQSYQKVSVVHFKDGREIRVRESLKTLEGILPDYRFVKAQRSYIISLDGLSEEHLTARYLILPHTHTSITLNREVRHKIRELLRYTSSAIPNNAATPIK